MKFCLAILLILISNTIFSQSDSIETKLKTATRINLWSTYYYIPSLNHTEDGIALLDEHEKKLDLKLDSCDWCTAALEGTVIIQKQNKTYTLNYAGRSNYLLVDCRVCHAFKTYSNNNQTGKVLWAISSGFGKGVKNYDLIPFKTIAVDPSVIPYGSKVYIPLAKGVEYSDHHGDVVKHDGFFFAHDTGSQIKGNHIDVFIGTTTKNPFDFISSKPTETFEAYILINQ